jgi:hypothetical protein
VIVFFLEAHVLKAAVAAGKGAGKHMQVQVKKLFGGGLLQVDTFTAERYSPHQITRHNSKVQAPSPKGTTRLAKGVSNTAPKKKICFAPTT